MEREEEKRLIKQSNEVHGIIVGTGDEPGLCEKHRQLERRVNRIEFGAKWVIGIFSTVIGGIFTFIWHKLLRQ